MARTNLAVLPDVTSCLRDAMDTMFKTDDHYQFNSINNGQKRVTSDDNDIIIDVVNDDDSSLLNNTESPTNKRKLSNPAMKNFEQQNSNGDDSSKRLCKMNGHH